MKERKNERTTARDEAKTEEIQKDKKKETTTTRNKERKKRMK